MSDKKLTEESAKWLDDTEKKHKFINWYETVNYTYEIDGTTINAICTVPSWKLIEYHQKLIKQDTKVTVGQLAIFEALVRDEVENDRCGEESD